MSILEQILAFFNGDVSAKLASLIVIIFGILKVAKIVVSLTASTKDDEIVAKIEALLEFLRPKDQAGALTTKIAKPTMAQKFWKAI